MTDDIKITYIPKFADVEDMSALMGIGWVSRDSAPRNEYWDTTLEKPYTYGRGAGERTYEPNERLELVDKYRGMLVSRLNVYFEGCFLNKYEDSKDHLGWHSDDDAGIDHSKPIAVITFGAEREINWKKIGSKGQDSINRRVLKNGSLFVMPAGMQATHLHRIPKAGFDAGPRISLTFRSLLEVVENTNNADS